MKKQEILDRVKEHLSARLNCTKEDFTKDKVCFVPNEKQKSPFLEICTMGQSVIVSASRETENLWEMGIDVRPEYRNTGLATLLVNNLAIKIMEKGIIPFYCASTTNVASQAVAHRSGLIPCWVSTYRTILDGSSAYNEIIGRLKL